jgi:hypothetical protein
MVHKARRTLPLSDYIHTIQRGKFKPELRSKLITWISTLTRAFRYHHETCYYAINYMDRYFSTICVSRHHSTVATAAFYLAAKFNEEEREPRALDVADCCTALGQDTTPISIQRLERKMLLALGHDMLIVSPHAVLLQVVKSVEWLDQDLIHTKGTKDAVVWECAHAFLDAVVHDVRVLLYCPVLLAFACLNCSMDAAVIGLVPAHKRSLLDQMPRWWQDAQACLSLEACEMEQCRAFVWQSTTRA